MPPSAAETCPVIIPSPSLPSTTASPYSHALDEGITADFDLTRAYIQSAKMGAITPLLKQELQYKIRARRLSEGMTEIPVPETEKKSVDNKLTEEEVRRRMRRRKQNQESSRRLRQRKMSIEDAMLKRVNTLTADYNKLRRVRNSLLDEKRCLLTQLNDFSNRALMESDSSNTSYASPPKLNTKASPSQTGNLSLVSEESSEEEEDIISSSKPRNVISPSESRNEISPIDIANIILPTETNSPNETENTILSTETDDNILPNEAEKTTLPSGDMIESIEVGNIILPSERRDAISLIETGCITALPEENLNQHISCSTARKLPSPKSLRKSGEESPFELMESPPNTLGLVMLPSEHKGQSVPATKVSPVSMKTISRRMTSPAKSVTMAPLSATSKTTLVVTSPSKNRNQNIESLAISPESNCEMMALNSKTKHMVSLLPKHPNVISLSAESMNRGMVSSSLTSPGSSPPKKTCMISTSKSENLISLSTENPSQRFISRENPKRMNLKSADSSNRRMASPPKPEKMIVLSAESPTQGVVLPSISKISTESQNRGMTSSPKPVNKISISRGGQNRCMTSPPKPETIILISTESQNWDIISPQKPENMISISTQSQHQRMISPPKPMNMISLLANSPSRRNVTPPNADNLMSFLAAERPSRRMVTPSKSGNLILLPSQARRIVLPQNPEKHISLSAEMPTSCLLSPP
ncbi:uncharacterized protein [Argopecten irradians]|uniref:uncharacterized protein n=1 Tax=Argopecten irradians TaxID=31199 RepID=UPI003713F8DA